MNKLYDSDQQLIIAKILLKRNFVEQVTRFSSLLGLVLGMFFLLLLPIFIAQEAYPAFRGEINLRTFLFSDPWLPLAAPPKFGIVHALLATFMITGLALILAIPIGIGIGIFLSEIAPIWIQAIFQPCMELLAGIPSVVYGFFGYFTICNWIENIFDLVTGESILAASIILAIMVLPFIVNTSLEAFSTVGIDLKEAGLSMGVTRWYMIRKVMLKKAAPGLFAAIILGFSRAISETFAVLILAGNSVAVPHSPLSRGQPLTALIITELGESGIGTIKYHVLFAAGFILMIIVVCINFLIILLKKRWISHEY